jgi:dephospho-CoA kinase
MTKRVVGLTGGIASGKSTVGKMLMELGVLVLDADQLSREVVEPGTQGLQSIVNVFGTEYLTPEGTLDRPKLGLLVFSDPTALSCLEEIVHPLVADLFAQKCSKAQEYPTPYIVYENAILVETGLDKQMDKVVVVSASLDLQLARVMKRNNLTLDQAQARLAAQLPLSVKLDAADIVIINDNDREALRERVLRAHQLLLG